TCRFPQIPVNWPASQTGGFAAAGRGARGPYLGFAVLIFRSVLAQISPSLADTLTAGWEWWEPEYARVLGRPAGRARCVVARDPARQAVEAGKEHALVDPGLVELVADLPLQLGWDHEPARKVFVLSEPLVERRIGR